LPVITISVAFAGLFLRLYEPVFVALRILEFERILGSTWLAS
jgi:hypothetical protein